jgi:hypothetical protein
MSKQTREFFEQIKAGEQPSLASTLKEIGGKMWDAMTPTFDHGAHEMAAALFRGDAFVMYPRTNQAERPDHGQPEMQQEHDRGGRDM